MDPKPTIKSALTAMLIAQFLGGSTLAQTTLQEGVPQEEEQRDFLVGYILSDRRLLDRGARNLVGGWLIGFKEPLPRESGGLAIDQTIDLLGRRMDVDMIRPFKLYEDGDAREQGFFGKTLGMFYSLMSYRSRTIDRCSLRGNASIQTLGFSPDGSVSLAENLTERDRGRALSRRDDNTCPKGARFLASTEALAALGRGEHPEPAGASGGRDSTRRGDDADAQRRTGDRERNRTPRYNESWVDRESSPGRQGRRNDRLAARADGRAAQRDGTGARRPENPGQPEGRPRVETEADDGSPTEVRGFRVGDRFDIQFLSYRRYRPDEPPDRFNQCVQVGTASIVGFAPDSSFAILENMVEDRSYLGNGVCQEGEQFIAGFGSLERLDRRGQRFPPEEPEEDGGDTPTEVEGLRIGQRFHIQKWVFPVDESLQGEPHITDDGDSCLQAGTARIVSFSFSSDEGFALMENERMTTLNADCSRGDRFWMPIDELP